MNEPPNDAQIIPVIDEELVTVKRIVKTGSVRVQKRVEQRTEAVSMPLIRETVDIERIPMNREVEWMPEIRTIGATTIIPVVEEQIVFTKRLILKEEIHMTRRHTKEMITKQVNVGRERAEILRVDADGRVVSSE